MPHTHPQSVHLPSSIHRLIAVNIFQCAPKIILHKPGLLEVGIAGPPWCKQINHSPRCNSKTLVATILHQSSIQTRISTQIESPCWNALNLDQMLFCVRQNRRKGIGPLSQHLFHKVTVAVGDDHLPAAADC